MIENKLGEDLPPHPGPFVPLKGYLVKESKNQIWIQDSLGTWIVEVSDVIGRRPLSDAGEHPFAGTPVILYIKDGAKILEIRTVKVTATQDWPLAVADTARMLDVRGYSEVDTLAVDRMKDFGLLASGPRPHPKPTYSPGPDTTGWGMVIHRDDTALQ